MISPVAGSVARRPLGHPADEPRHLGMSLQAIDGGIVPGEFHFGKNAVDLAVADLVKDGDGTMLAPFQLGDQVMAALEFRGNRSPAERTESPPGLRVSLRCGIG